MVLGIQTQVLMPVHKWLAQFTWLSNLPRLPKKNLKFKSFTNVSLPVPTKTICSGIYSVSVWRLSLTSLSKLSVYGKGTSNIKSVSIRCSSLYIKFTVSKLTIPQLVKASFPPLNTIYMALANSPYPPMSVSQTDLSLPIFMASNHMESLLFFLSFFFFLMFLSRQGFFV